MVKNIFAFGAIALALTLGATLMDKKTGGDRDSTPVSSAKWSQNRHTAAERVTAIAADRNGHFNVAALVNGVHVEMLADTGATLVALSEADAVRVGIDPGGLTYDVPVQTANGTATAARAVLDEVAVGGIRVRDVEALVAPAGALGKSLLGMSFIGAIGRFELRGDQLVLVQ